jgi:uncharacterized protein (DUF885 family)
MMDQRILQLGGQYLFEYRRFHPSEATMLGDHRFDAQAEDVSRENEDRHIAALRDIARSAAAIDDAGLTLQDRLGRDVLAFHATTRADYYEAHLAEIDANPAISPHVLLPTAATQFPITEPEHAEDLLEKYRGYETTFRRWAARLSEGASVDRTPPALMVEKVIGQLDAVLATSPEADPLVTAVRAPVSFDETQKTEWRNRLAQAVRDHVRAGLAELRRVLSEEVVGFARPQEEVGLRWIRGGEEAYQRAIHYYTTVDLTAEEIHQIGLETVAALDEEYRELGRQALGTEDLPSIYAALRDDPDLHFTDGTDVVAASERALAKAKAAMGDWFGRLPKADCVVSSVTQGPTAFYFPPAADGSRPGTFFVNVEDPTSWGRFEIEAFAYHEGIPGHHLQIATAHELNDVPEFRRYMRVIAYAEGWGLYTERLADEMGLYGGPLERMGMLSADSMRATRLVVDTGMHALGWSRQQAIDYVAANAPLSLKTISDEVDRYIGLPGQALAYMIGRKEIVKMRERAETALGDRFDIQGFHDTVLGSGALPLPVLSGLVDEWVADHA